MRLSGVKNYCLLCLLSMVSLALLAQKPSHSITIDWEAPKKILDSLGKERYALSFQNALYLHETHYLPTYRFSIPGNVTDFKITNTVTEALTADEQKIVSQTYDPSIFKTKIDVKYHNGSPVSIIYVIPVQSGAAGITDKIISFEYSFQRNFSFPQDAAVNLRIKRNGMRLAANATSSVLASGNWYKVSITQSGIFKIDYDFIKTQLGLNPDEINPREIKIYGNGGGMLPQKISDSRHDDLVENPIYVHGENDGVFNNTDYILFYGQGPGTWEYAPAKGRFVHTKNLYSDHAFYFITIGPGNGLRIQDRPSLAGPAPQILSFDERVSHENDLHNIVHSGREWFGEEFFQNDELTFSFNLPGITSNTNLRLHSYVLGRSLTGGSFTISLNNQSFTPTSTQSLSAISATTHAIKGDTDTATFTMNTNQISGSLVNVKLRFNSSSSTGRGHLNYLEINVPRDLRLYGNQTAFRSISSISQPISEFVIQSATNSMKIWDITDPVNPLNQLFTLNGSEATFVTDTDVLREFVAFSGASFASPSYEGSVSNQNLHGIIAPGLPDMVIVTHPNYMSAANRLAQFRKSNDNMDVTVVTTTQVFNEFSSGKQDVTAIRDFMKMLYDRGAGPDSLKYLLLFGDGSFDYKNRLANNTNYVPIYESRQSLHPVDSYSSDDYFGLLNNHSGEWVENYLGDDTLRIGIGRLPVKNATEAENAINKIIHYSTSNSTLGKWRNKITLIADDGDTNLHLKDADYLAEFIKSNYRDYNVNKIFLDAYPQISGPGGETSPQATESVIQAVQKGTLVLNYTGHGGETQLGQEVLVNIFQINQWNNFNALPLFVTATCEFGRYDDPGVVSGAETALLNSSGGAIALITSTRPVYSNSNKNLNEAIYKSIFIPHNGNMPRLGDIMRLTKNKSLYGINNRNYALLGDPSLTLAYPKENVVVTKINNNVPSVTDTLKALSTATIEGEIRDGAGNKISQFTGSVYVTIYDKESIIPTFGTQGSPATSFKAMNNLIYEGLATVENGSFKTSFVIPKDISYQFDKGKISFYAKKDNSTLDANGYNTDIIIGGSDENSIADNTPPKIKLFMNDESFVFGGLTSENSLFLAKVEDDNGINIAGQGIGHEITAILDNSDEVLILNDYYSAVKDNYKEGRVEYPMKNLSPGNHSIKFKCWDTHNNSETAYLEFVVANNEKVALEHVLNYPNPFSSHTAFHFDHNRAGDDLDVMVQIYTISGRLIKTLDDRILSSGSHISNLVWDGRDDFGDKIGKGVYVYKVNVRSLRDGSNQFKYQKLVILN